MGCIQQKALGLLPNEHFVWNSPNPLKYGFTFYEVFHIHIHTVEHSVGKLSNPITQDKHACITCYHEVEFYVSVTKHEVVDVGVRSCVGFGKPHERLLVFTLVGRLLSVFAFQT